MKNKTVLLFAFIASLASAQQISRWSATTGDVVLSASGTAATVQQPAQNGVHVLLESATVYCSVACNITQAANGTAATATSGTVKPLLPTSMSASAPFNFFTASNVGAGTAQGGILHLAAGQTMVICLSTSCGAGQNVELAGGGSGTNYAVSVSSITGTANITFIAQTRN